MAPRLTAPDARIDAVRGCVAVERGPEVLALESVDLTPAGVDDVGLVAFAAHAEPVERDGRVWIDVVRLPEGDPAWPYRDAAGRPTPADRASVPLVAYHEWAERGPSTMRVWIPVV
jgi:DUF1680 family protein